MSPDATRELAFECPYSLEEQYVTELHKLYASERTSHAITAFSTVVNKVTRLN